MFLPPLVEKQRQNLSKSTGKNMSRQHHVTTLRKTARREQLKLFGMTNHRGLIKKKLSNINIRRSNEQPSMCNFEERLY